MATLTFQQSELVDLNFLIATTVGLLNDQSCQQFIFIPVTLDLDTVRRGLSGNG